MSTHRPNWRSRAVTRSALPQWLPAGRGLLVSLSFLGATACQPEEDSAASPTVPAPSCDTWQPATAEARLLTASEYRRTVQDLLLTTTDPTLDFPPEPVVNGFSNSASSHQANPLLVEKYFKAASKLAQDAGAAGLDRLYSCQASVTEQDCAAAFIENFGLRAYRRPLSMVEKDSLIRLYGRGVENLGHEQALVSVVEAMLQSPQFLYRVESPVSPTQAGVVALGPYELASRLSYFLQGTLPDAELLEAASAGALATVEQVEKHARRLLLDPKARSRIREFHTAWLDLDRLSSIARDGAPTGLSESLKESVLRFTERVFYGSSHVEELYTSAQLDVDGTLANVLGLSPPETEWMTVELPGERRGLSTQPALMTLLAHANQSSPIQRGVFIREHFLCDPVEPPPPSVNNNPPDPMPGLTTRELFEVHTESPACAQCHLLIDPVGFGFEAYDHLGRYRSTEEGVSIDTTGELLGFSEQQLSGPFDGAHEFADKIAPSETVLTCLTHKWFTFAMGRSHQTGDHCSLDSAALQSRAEGGSMLEMLVAISTSDSFRFRAAHEADLQGATP